MQAPMEPSIPVAADSERKKLIPLVYIIIGVIVLLVIAVFFIWGIIWLANNYATNIEVVRDVMIIAFALESCLFGIVLLLLLIMVIRLVNMLEFEIKPILEKTNETIGMVRGTTVFVSENVVKPTISAKSYISGLRRGIKALFGNPKRNLPD